MNDLDMIKAFAKLECVDIRYNENGYAWLHADGSEYNPLLPKSLNCAARDKYEVQVSYDNNCCYISDQNAGEYDSGTLADVDYSSHNDIPRAVIICILQAGGLYK